MKHICASLLFSLISSVPVACEPVDTIPVLDNFKYGGMVFGSEDLIQDYATLATDPTGDLPKAFTICSSVHVKFVTTAQYFFQLYQENGQSWLNLKMHPARDTVKLLKE